MPYLNPDIFKNWQNAEIMNARDYRRERDLLIEAVNGLNAEMLQNRTNVESLKDLSYLDTVQMDYEGDSLIEGKIWLNTTDHQVKVYVNGVIKVVSLA